MTPTTQGLTRKQLRFVDEYMIDLNSTNAAKRAGYSAATARQMGSENLSKPVIRAEVQRRLDDRSTSLAFSSDEYLTSLLALANADIAEVFDKDGSPLPLAQMPAQWRESGLIKSVRITEKQSANGTSKTCSIHFASRTEILYLIGKHVGAW